MKKIAIIGLLAAVIVASVLAFRHHARILEARDKVFRQMLPGVWLRAEDNLPQTVQNFPQGAVRGAMPLSMRCTNTVASDGSFVELSWFRHSVQTNTYRRTGTWLVKDGKLVETIKTSTNPSEKTPHTLAGRIIRPDANGFTVRWPNSEETVWQRITQ